MNPRSQKNEKYCLTYLLFYVFPGVPRCCPLNVCPGPAAQRPTQPRHFSGTGFVSLPSPPYSSVVTFSLVVLLTKVFKVPSAGIAGGVRNNSANSYIRARVQFIIFKIVPFTKKVIYFFRRRSLLWTSHEQIISSQFDVQNAHCLFAS
jgi:hypothetical protein